MPTADGTQIPAARPLAVITAKRNMFLSERQGWKTLGDCDRMRHSTPNRSKREQEESRMKEVSKEKLQQVAGGVCEDAPHCPKCRSTDLILVGPTDIGTPPCYRCKSCGYEWMLAL